MGPPAKNKKVSLCNQKTSKQIGGLGDPMAPLKINKARGVLQLRLNS